MGLVGRRAMLDVALFVASQAALYYTMRWAISAMMPDSEKEREVNSKPLEALEKLGHKNLQLTSYERTVANEIVHPDDIDVTFASIGGLEPIIASLQESIIYPLLYPTSFQSALVSAPKGVLLFGPPGCGKTLLARALAKESNATFINIPPSVLTNKWYGESNKLVAGLFGLARKCQPCIVFIDEIDAFLRERTRGDHEVTGMVKAEFMTLWDGLLSSSDRILVLGATNRPTDIDPAFLRRMPKRFAVNLPNEDQRFKILTLLLAKTPTSPSLSLGTLAAATHGLSGSDLKELCREAAMVPVREYVRSRTTPLPHSESTTTTPINSLPPKRDSMGGAGGGAGEQITLRPLVISDFFANDGTSGLPRPFEVGLSASMPGVPDRSRLDGDGDGDGDPALPVL